MIAGEEMETQDVCNSGSLDRGLELEGHKRIGLVLKIELVIYKTMKDTTSIIE